MSALLVAQALAELIYVDFVRLRGFSAIRGILGRLPDQSPVSAGLEAVPAVVQAVGIAKVLYVKPVFCLQYSAAITRLLRRRGVPAELVIGCHLAPMYAHAWVEVEGKVVVEQIDAQEFFCILDRW
jgi:hypothetical protein